MNVEKTSLSVLSFSCGGIYANEGLLRLFRLHAITAHISSERYDLVALQECWMKEDFEFIRNDLKAILPHSHYFERAGIVMLSKYPIVAELYTRITDEDIVRIFFGTGYITEEGCGIVCLDHSDIGTLFFFACYMNPPSASNSECRQRQRKAKWSELNVLVQYFAGQSSKVILAGNFHSEEDPFSNCKDSQSRDSGLTTEPNCDITEISAQGHDVTFGSPLNTFTSKPSLRDTLRLHHGGERHDDIFYIKSPRITCKQNRIVMKEHMPGSNQSYSDHFGVHSVFSITVYVKLLGFEYADRPNYLEQNSFESHYLKWAILFALVYAGYCAINDWSSFQKEISNAFK